MLSAVYAQLTRVVIKHLINGRAHTSDWTDESISQLNWQCTLHSGTLSQVAAWAAAALIVSSVHERGTWSLLCHWWIADVQLCVLRPVRGHHQSSQMPVLRASWCQSVALASDWSWATECINIRATQRTRGPRDAVGTEAVVLPNEAADACWLLI